MKRRRGRGPSTTLVHEGMHWDWATGAVGTPVYQTATFLYPRKRRADGSWYEDASSYIYTRDGSPTMGAVERKMAALEGAPSSLAFGSGMAAIAAAVFPHLAPGARVTSMAEVYGGAWILFERHVKPLGVGVDFVHGSDADELASRVGEKTRLVFTEVPTNPFNRVLDLPRFRKALEKRWGRKRPVILTDATLATPLNLQPYHVGADVVVHSATKYLGGHSDLIAGVASGSRSMMDRVKEWRSHLGGSMDPHQAFLLERGMKTLDVRLRRQESNAKAVARFLERHPKVETVYHLSLPTHPDHKLGRRLLRGPGSLLSFRLRRRGRTGAVRFLKALELFAQAPSLGGVESLATIPRETSHRSHTEAEARAVGITPNLVRLSVGIEDAADLVSDVQRALSRA